MSGEASEGLIRVRQRLSVVEFFVFLAFFRGDFLEPRGDTDKVNYRRHFLREIRGSSATLAGMNPTVKTSGGSRPVIPGRPITYEP